MRRNPPDVLWLRDLIDHLSCCQAKLEWSSDPATLHNVTRAMIRTMDVSRRLCQTLHKKVRLEVVN